MKLWGNICDPVEGACGDISREMGIKIRTWERINRGCYADIYLLYCEDGISRILKYFRFPSVAGEEVRSYGILKRHEAFPLPELFWADEKRGYLCMEYMEGKALSGVAAPAPELSAKVVDCLLRCHRCQKKPGTRKPIDDWMSLYQGRQEEILARSAELAGRGLLDGAVYDLFGQSIACLGKVLGESVQSLSLLHGDYTPWNIIVDQDAGQVVGVLDPYSSCFGDREYDLMMMDKANGVQLGLLEQYQEYVPPSDMFVRKKVYYNSWNELCHYYYSDRKESMDISERAYELKQVI